MEQFKNQLKAHFKDKRVAAYVLATVWHETAGTFQPIAERGSPSYFLRYENRPKYGHTAKGDGFKYRGRGYAMITWKINYARFGKLLGIDLVKNPDLALEPNIAFKILTIGMTDGLFTGRKLSQYFNKTTCDWFNARTIINGHDKAQLIANKAKSYYENWD